MKLQNTQIEYEKVKNQLNANCGAEVVCSEKDLLNLQYFFLTQLNKAPEDRAKFFVSAQNGDWGQRRRIEAYLDLMRELHPATVYIKNEDNDYEPLKLDDTVALGRILPLMEIDLGKYKFLADQVEKNFGEFVKNDHFEVKLIISDKKDDDGDKKSVPKVDFSALEGNPFERVIKKACLNYMFTKAELSKNRWEERKYQFQQPRFYREVKGLSTLAFLLFCAYDKICELDKIYMDDKSNAIINACDVSDGILQLIENIVYHAGDEKNNGCGLLSFRIHSFYGKKEENTYLNQEFYHYFCGMDNRKPGNGERSELERLRELMGQKRTGVSGKIEDGEWSFFKEATELNKSIQERRERRKTIRHYIEIRICDNSGKSVVDEYLKNLHVDEKGKSVLKNMKIGDFFSPSTRTIQKELDNINHMEENAIHHYGLSLFDSLVASTDGCFIARNKKENGMTELYSTSGDGENEDMMPGTQYSVLLPLKREDQQYSNLNSDIKYTISEECLEAKYIKEKMAEDGIFDSQEEKEKAVHCCVKKMKDILLEDSIICFDAKMLGNVEIFIKALLLRIKQEDKRTKKNIAIYNCEFSDFIVITRLLAVFYNKGECDILENVQLYMNGRKNDEAIYDEFWMGGSSLSELFARVSKLTFAKSFSPRVVNILKAMLLKRTIIEKRDGRKREEQVQYTYTPFDLIIKNDKGMTVFEQNVHGILDTELQDRRFGCKIKGTHMRLGSKIHVDDFYEAQLLFHNNYFTNRFAYLLKKKLEELRDVSDTRKLYFIGYEKYSEMLLYELTQLFGSLNADYCIYEQGIENDAGEVSEACFRRLNTKLLLEEDIQLVFVVPINSTLSTFNKVEAEFMQTVKREKFDNLPIYLGIIQTRTTESEVSGEKNIGKNGVRKVEEDFWEEIVCKDRKIISRFINQNKEPIRVYYLILVEMMWRNPLRCRKCYPIYCLEEEPLIETDKSSVIPAQMIGLRKRNGGRLNYDIEENRKRILDLKGYVYEGHFERNRNHYQYYVNTEAFFENNREKIKKWLKGIRKKINPANAELHYDIIVCPLHSSNAAFVELVNKEIFGDASLVIHFEVDKEFRDNFIAKYSDVIAVYNHLKNSGQKASMNFIFVDDEIIKGRTIERTKSLIHSLFPQEESIVKVNIFHSIIVLINRLSSDTIGNYSTLEKYYSYVKIRISHLRGHGNACILCNKYNKSGELARYAALNASYKFWDEKKKNYILDSLEHKKEILEDKPCPIGWMHMFSSHQLTESLGMLDDREDTQQVFERYLEVIEDKEIDHKQKEDYVKSCLYVASNPFVCFRKSNREAIFKLILIALDVILAKKKNQQWTQSLVEVILKSITVDSGITLGKMSIEKKLKKVLSRIKPNCENLMFLMEQSVALRSNYIIRKENMDKILGFLKANANGKKELERLKEEYRMMIKELVTSGTDESKQTFLEYLLLSGEEYPKEESISDEIAMSSHGLRICDGRDEFREFFEKVYLENTKLFLDAVKDFNKRGVGTGEEYYIKNYSRILSWHSEDFKTKSESLLELYRILQESGSKNEEDLRKTYNNLARQIKVVLGTCGKRIEFVCTITSSGLKINDKHQVERCEVEKYEHFASSEPMGKRESILEHLNKMDKSKYGMEGDEETYRWYSIKQDSKKDVSNFYDNGDEIQIIVLTFKSSKLMRPIYLSMEFREKTSRMEILKSMRYILTFRSMLLESFEMDFSSNLLQQMLETLAVQNQLAKARAGFHMSGEACDIKNPLNAAEAYFFDTRATCEVDRSEMNVENYHNEKLKKIVEAFGYDLEKALYGMAINTRIGRANIKLLTKDYFDSAGLNLGYLKKQIGDIPKYSHFGDKFELCDKKKKPLTAEALQNVFAGKRYKGKEVDGEILYMHRDYLRALIIEVIQSAGRHGGGNKNNPSKVCLWSEGEMLWVKNAVESKDFSIENSIQPALMREQEGISLVTLCEMFCEFYADDESRRVKILYQNGYLSIGMPIFESEVEE